MKTRHSLNYYSESIAWILSSQSMSFSGSTRTGEERGELMRHEEHAISHSLFNLAACLFTGETETWLKLRPSMQLAVVRDYVLKDLYLKAALEKDP